MSEWSGIPPELPTKNLVKFRVYGEELIMFNIPLARKN
jgi:hypothetical protein